MRKLLRRRQLIPVLLQVPWQYKCVAFLPPKVRPVDGRYTFQKAQFVPVIRGYVAHVLFHANLDKNSMDVQQYPEPADVD